MPSLIINGILNIGSDNMEKIDRRLVKSHGDIKFKLADRMKEQGLSKNRLFVLSEFCRVLGCNVQDVIEYAPKKK